MAATRKKTTAKPKLERSWYLILPNGVEVGRVVAKPMPTLSWSWTRYTQPLLVSSVPAWARGSYHIAVDAAKKEEPATEQIPIRLSESDLRALASSLYHNENTLSMMAKEAHRLSCNAIDSAREANNRSRKIDSHLGWIAILAVIACIVSAIALTTAF